jgi:hypothetical protein
LLPLTSPNAFEDAKASSGRPLLIFKRIAFGAVLVLETEMYRAPPQEKFAMMG